MGAMAGICRVIGNSLKFSILKISGRDISCKGMCTSRLDNEYRVSKDGKLHVGYHFSSLRRCRFLVSGGELTIGDNVGLNTNCIVACHEKIVIGNDVEFGPNVCVYDHDHDFRAEGGLKAAKFITAPVEIGDGTWVGANTIILRGAKIGKECVIGAGCIVSGLIPDGSILTQKREDTIKPIGR